MYFTYALSKYTHANKNIACGKYFAHALYNFTHVSAIYRMRKIFSACVIDINARE